MRNTRQGHQLKKSFKIGLASVVQCATIGGEDRTMTCHECNCHLEEDEARSIELAGEGWLDVCSDCLISLQRECDAEESYQRSLYSLPR